MLAELRELKKGKSFSAEDLGVGYVKN